MSGGVVRILKPRARRGIDAGAAFATGVALAILCVPPAPGESKAREAHPLPAENLRSPSMRIEVRGPADAAFAGGAAAAPGGSLLREIVDPCLGIHWEWISNAEHPAWPARLVRIDSGYRSLPSPRAPEDESANRLPRATAAQAAQTDRPVLIRAGDRVTVVQETSILRARLQAVALEPAASGESLRVRLIGGADIHTGNQGAVVLVRAVSAHEATWLGTGRNFP